MMERNYPILERLMKESVMMTQSFEETMRQQEEMLSREVKRMLKL